MRPRTVQAVDGREWVVDSHTEWSRPATGDDFEHDVGGRGAGVFLFGTVAFFWLVFLLWWPDQAFVPWYFWVGGALLVAFFPLRWWFRRLVTITAETPGNKYHPAERWVGAVRGLRRVHDEKVIITRRLRTQGTPGYADSPLQPIN